MTTSLARSRIPSFWGQMTIDQRTQFKQTVNLQARRGHEAAVRRLGSGHPDGQQRQRPIALTDDQMRGACVPFRAGDENRSSMLGMEWVSDDHVDRQIPGSMTLFRLEPGRLTSRPRSAFKPSRAAARRCVATIRMRCARRSWRVPAGASPAQEGGSARLVASVAARKATTAAKRTQQLCGVWE